jgi:hypothetical protein
MSQAMVLNKHYQSHIAVRYKGEKYEYGRKAYIVTAKRCTLQPGIKTSSIFMNIFIRI